MSNNLYTDKEYFDLAFKSIGTNFDNVISRLDKLNNDKIPSIEKRVDCLETKDKVAEAIKQNFWRKNKRTIEIISVVIAFLALFGLNWWNKIITVQVREKSEVTNQILVPGAIKRGLSLDSLGLNGGYR